MTDKIQKSKKSLKTMKPLNNKITETNSKKTSSSKVVLNDIDNYSSDIDSEEDGEYSNNTELKLGEESKSISRMNNNIASNSIIKTNKQGVIFYRPMNLKNWTKEEDIALLEAAEKNNYKCWKKIADHLPGRSAIQCSARFKRIKPGIIKGAWTKEEDDKLLELVSQLGTNWALISNYMGSRSGKQVRDRFLNTLNPNLNRNKFSAEEDDLILKLYKDLGCKWSQIANSFVNRTGDMIKNRFYSSLRKNVLKVDYLRQKSKRDLFCSEGRVIEVYKDNGKNSKDNLKNIKHEISEKSEKQENSSRLLSSKNNQKLYSISEKEDSNSHNENKPTVITNNFLKLKNNTSSKGTENNTANIINTSNINKNTSSFNYFSFGDNNSSKTPTSNMHTSIATSNLNKNSNATNNLFLRRKPARQTEHTTQNTTSKIDFNAITTTDLIKDSKFNRLSNKSSNNTTGNINLDKSAPKVKFVIKKQNSNNSNFTLRAKSNNNLNDNSNNQDTKTLYVNDEIKNIVKEDIQNRKRRRRQARNSDKNISSHSNNENVSSSVVNNENNTNYNNMLNNNVIIQLLQMSNSDQDPNLISDIKNISNMSNIDISTLNNRLKFWFICNVLNTNSNNLNMDSLINNNNINNIPNTNSVNHSNNIHNNNIVYNNNSNNSNINNNYNNNYNSSSNYNSATLNLSTNNLSRSKTNQTGTLSNFNTNNLSSQTGNLSNCTNTANLNNFIFFEKRQETNETDIKDLYINSNNNNNNTNNLNTGTLSNVSYFFNRKNTLNRSSNQNNGITSNNSTSNLLNSNFNSNPNNNNNMNNSNSININKLVVHNIYSRKPSNTTNMNLEASNSFSNMKKEINNNTENINNLKANFDQTSNQQYVCIFNNNIDQNNNHQEKENEIINQNYENNSDLHSELCIGDNKSLFSFINNAIEDSKLLCTNRNYYVNNENTPIDTMNNSFINNNSTKAKIIETNDKNNDKEEDFLSKKEKEIDNLSSLKGNLLDSFNIITKKTDSLFDKIKLEACDNKSNTTFPIDNHILSTQLRNLEDLQEQMTKRINTFGDSLFNQNWEHKLA